MTDIFISYSRRDHDFVSKLVSALEDRELSVWVDWEGIPPTAAWLAEIQHAIEGADHFLFVISPDSVASEMCQLELAHAVEHHKRLVPLRFRSAEQDLLPAALRETQWLEIAEDEPFDAAMERLVIAIRTDPETVRWHTRLLTGAIEWQSRGHERSLLLRGQDLAAAEKWLRTNSQYPAPTELQREFIAESRRSAIWLRRIVAGVAMTAALALLVIGAYYLRERKIAREQALASLSRATAAQALAEQERAYELALLLAVEAHAIRPTLEAEGALQRILLGKPRLERTLATPTAETVGLGFNRDGDRLAAGFGDGAMRIWTVASGARTDLAAEAGLPATAYAFNADLSLAAAGSGQRDAITLSRLPEGASVALSSPNGRSEILELQFSPDGRLLAAANGSQPAGITVWDTATKRTRGRPLTSDGGLAAVGFSPDGRSVASGGWSEHVLLWDVDSGRLLQRRKIEGGVPSSGVALSSQWLAAASGDIQLFDLSRPEQGSARILKSAGNSVRSVAFDPDGRWLAAGSDAGIVQLWRVDNPQSPGELLNTQGSYVDELAFSTDGKQLATGGYGQPVRIYATESISRFGRFIGSQAQTVATVRFSPDGSQVAAAGQERVIDLWALAGNRHERMSGHVSDIRALAFTPDGTMLVSADARVLPSAQGRVDLLRWDLQPSPVRLVSPAPEAVKRESILAMFPDLPILRETPWPVALDAAGETLARPGPYAGGASPIEVINTVTGRVLSMLETGFGHDILSLALNADGKRVAASAADGRYRVWDVADGDHLLLDAHSPHSESCGAIALSQDGKRVAVACGGNLAVYALEDDAHRIAYIEMPSGTIEALAFDPSGQRLATSDADASWTLWDVAASRSVGMAFPAPSVISALSFSPNGKRLLTGDREGRVIVWDIAREDWLREACLAAGRELTPDEWQRYLPNRTPHPTCADVARYPGDKR